MLAWRGNGISFQREVDCRHGLASLGEIAWGNSPCGGHRDEAMVIYGELDGTGKSGTLNGYWKNAGHGAAPLPALAAIYTCRTQTHARTHYHERDFSRHMLCRFFPRVLRAEMPHAVSDRPGGQGGLMRRAS